MKLTQTLGPELPFVRRYARALTGDQSIGDSYVRATLEALVHGDLIMDVSLSPRVALYRVFEAIWQSSGARLETPRFDDGHFDDGRARPNTISGRLMRIAPRSRQAFLLTAVEGFSHQEAAWILSTDEEEVADLIAEAQSDIDAQLATAVLIIEDEPVIAADISALVSDLGHRVTFIATTRSEATAAAARDRPGLILADVQLADGSSGLDAATDILATIDVPVIVITGFPERLLTGRALEPTFLITKPFQTATVKAAIGQALFFHPGVEAKAA